MADRANLASLYESAIYRIALPTIFVQLEVAGSSPELDRWLRENGFDRAAYVTAANPRSTMLDEGENAERHQRLLARVDTLGILSLLAESRDRRGDWHEAGLLLLGVEEIEALRLAREFGQAAILTLEQGQPARLSWT